MTKSTQHTEQNQSSQTGPWSEAVPYLTSFLKNVGSTGSAIQPTDKQNDSYAQLEANAAGGNPFTPQITSIANDALNAKSNSGQVQQAATQLESNLGGYADGSKLDPLSNPQMHEMLKYVGDDTTNRINQMFAGAGRDFSGYNQKAIGAGLASAELPQLLAQYNTNVGNQFTAANAINSAKTNAATTGQSLDANALATRTGGIATAGQAVNAQNYAPNTILNLEQQKQTLPLQDLALYASLLLPVAGMGSTSQGQSSGTSTTSGVDFAKGAMGLGALL